MSEKQFLEGLCQVLVNVYVHQVDRILDINLEDFSDFVCEVSTRQKLKYERGFSSTHAWSKTRLMGF